MEFRIEANQGSTPQLSASQRRAADLFDEHFDAVYRYCLSRTSDPAIAEDAAAQTFYEAARRLADEPASEVDRAWLFVVAKRRVVDGWRRQDRQRRVVERMAASTPRHLGRVQEPDGARVVAALASLSERQRRAVVLRYLDEYSVAEIADSLETTYSGAESLLARGRRGFVRAWKEHRDDNAI